MVVALTTDGSTAVVSAPFDDRPVEGAGATYIFNVGVDDDPPDR